MVIYDPRLCLTYECITLTCIALGLHLIGGCAVVQDRVKRVENCVNVQAQVPTDPTVKSFGLSIKGQMMEVRSCFANPKCFSFQTQCTLSVLLKQACHSICQDADNAEGSPFAIQPMFVRQHGPLSFSSVLTVLLVPICLSRM